MVEAVHVVQDPDFLQQADPVGTVVFQPADEGRDEGRAGLCRCWTNGFAWTLEMLTIPRRESRADMQAALRKPEVEQ